MSVGKIKEFEVKSGNWVAYVERIEMYFLANKIGDDLKLPTLISVMGEEAYELLSSLASPAKPSTLKFDQAVSLLQDHLQPKPSEVAERYRFRQRRQVAGESIADYVAELKKLSRFCNFEKVLEDNLCDQFVCGLKSELIRQRLFAEENLTYSKAVSLATTLEAAEKDVGAVEISNTEIKNSTKMECMNKLQIRSCTACGHSRHRKSDCRYKGFQCSLCQETGHLRRMCPKKSSEASERIKWTASTAGHIGERSRYWQSRAIQRGGRGERGERSWRWRGAAAAAGRPVDTYWVQQQGAPAEEQHPAAHHSSSEDGDNQGDIEEPMYQMSLTKYKPA